MAGLIPGLPGEPLQSASELALAIGPVDPAFLAIVVPIDERHVLRVTGISIGDIGAYIRLPFFVAADWGISIFARKRHWG